MSVIRAVSRGGGGGGGALKVSGTPQISQVIDNYTSNLLICEKKLWLEPPQIYQEPPQVYREPSQFSLKPPQMYGLGTSLF